MVALNTAVVVILSQQLRFCGRFSAYFVLLAADVDDVHSTRAPGTFYLSIYQCPSFSLQKNQSVYNKFLRHAFGGAWWKRDDDVRLSQNNSNYFSPFFLGDTRPWWYNVENIQKSKRAPGSSKKFIFIFFFSNNKNKLYMKIKVLKGFIYSDNNNTTHRRPSLRVD